MERKHKVYLKLNLMSLFFIAVSFISVTLAWFAYSGMANVAAEFGVKAWYIEFQKNGSGEISNNIEISLTDIYPGMTTVNEIVNINNLGDSDANLTYSIVSARILDTEYVVGDSITSEELEDKLSHDYPFHVNINLSKKYVASKGTESVFDVSISWPFDSDNDTNDSSWGNSAYNFQLNEQALRGQDARSSIQIIIQVTAEQYLVSSPTSSDMKYNLGDIVLYDVKNNRGCTEVSDTCIRTHVIDTNSTLADDKVSLLPDIYGTYATAQFVDYKTALDSMFGDEIDKWKVGYRELTVDDLMRIISNDILNSLLIRDNLSDSIIGNLNYPGRMETELSKASSYNGHYLFDSNKFNYIVSNRCYWTSSNYDDETNKAYAFVKHDEAHGKIYGESKDALCSVVPVIEVYKVKIEQTD